MKDQEAKLLTMLPEVKRLMAILAEGGELTEVEYHYVTSFSQSMSLLMVAFLTTPSEEADPMVEYIEGWWLAISPEDRVLIDSYLESI